MNKKSIINSFDIELNKLTHVSKIKDLNIFIKNLNNRQYENLLLDKNNQDFKYIIKPDFNVETMVPLNVNNGLLNYFVPAFYEINYGTIDTDFIKPVRNDFMAFKISKLQISENESKIHLDPYRIEYKIFNNIYSNLLRYLLNEKNFRTFTDNDLKWLFRESLELCYYNHHKNINYIIDNGNDSKSYENIKKMYTINMIDETIKTSECNYNPWTKINTYLDNRKLENGKILTLKSQAKK